MRYEKIDPKLLVRYQKLFFGEICLIPLDEREQYSVPLPGMTNAHFACVQDKVERLIEETGKLSTFQWRSCIFVAVDKAVKINEIYQEVYDDLRKFDPSLFIRSYVYVVFIKVQARNEQIPGFDFDPESMHISKDDLQIYAWNTNYDIKLQGKTDLFNLRSVEQRNEGSFSPVENKVFIINNPAQELKRIHDANSDVIDAARAYLGDLDLISQTSTMLNDIKEALESSESARVLLEGPARSGKTIIALSLLAAFPNAKMLLMNWYFYDALYDAFKVWGKLDEGEIKRLFYPDRNMLRLVREKNYERKQLSFYKDNPEVLDIEIMMREWPKNSLEGCPHWFNAGTQDNPDFRINNITKKNQEDVVFAIARNGSMDVVRIEEVFPENQSAKAEHVYKYDGKEKHCRLLDKEDENKAALETLKRFKDILDKGIAESYITNLVQEISKALSSSKQRFFHHDRRNSEGLWIDENEIIIPNSDLLICDEAQRLGNYNGLNEADVISERKGRLFLCGDDFQKLNQRGDLGIEKVKESSASPYIYYELPDSVGIPAEIGEFVKGILGCGPIPKLRSSFNIKVLFKNDPGLVDLFKRDPSYKKHFALPVSSGFYPSKYVPGIYRSYQTTEECSSKCDDFCSHRFIPMLSPLSDPRFEKNGKRKDLSRDYKFFCAEQIMPNYALSAYELISREVESLYLKIPWHITRSIIDVPIDDDSLKESWIKRHLYVLMTRPTAQLVVNVEDKSLFEHFCDICARAGVAM